MVSLSEYLQSGTIAKLGTCESIFFRSNWISNRIGRTIFFGIESAVYHASRNTA